MLDIALHNPSPLWKILEVTEVISLIVSVIIRNVKDRKAAVEIQIKRTETDKTSSKLCNTNHLRVPSSVCRFILMYCLIELSSFLSYVVSVTSALVGVLFLARYYLPLFQLL